MISIYTGAGLPSLVIGKTEIYIYLAIYLSEKLFRASKLYTPLLIFSCFVAAVSLSFLTMFVYLALHGVYSVSSILTVLFFLYVYIFLQKIKKFI